MSTFLPVGDSIKLVASVPESASAAAVASVLPLLDRLLQGTLALRRMAADGPVDAARADLRRVHAELEATPIPVVRPMPSIDASIAARACAAGALRLQYYRQTVLARRPLIDTVGSVTLGEYEPDLFLRSQAQVDRWRADTAAASSLSTQTLDDIEAAILPDEIHAVGLRKHLMDALVEVLDLQKAPRVAAKQLMDALFPGHPLRADECELIATAASIYLCLPYEQDHWTTRGPEQEDDSALIAFLKRISRPLQTTMAHFPAFAPIRPDEIDLTLLRQLAAHCGQDIEDVRVRLCTMVTILPAPKVDQYIIHDVWGHQWQAHLFRFEEAYLRVADMTRRPAVNADMLAVCEVWRTGRQIAARAAWEAWLTAQLDANLLDSLTGLIAEVFADAIEHKFLVLQPARHALLLSSSYFKELPTKLDLTLADLPLYFRFAMRGLRLLADPGQRAALRAEIAAECSDWSAEELDACSEVLCGWTAELLARPAWSARFADGSEDWSGSLSAFSMTALEFARFQLAFNRIHAQLARTSDPVHPLLLRFQDLLIFCCASFFEEDRVHNFWRLTEFVELHFMPWYERLLVAGADPGSSP